MLARWKEGSVLLFSRGLGCSGEMDAVAEEQARLEAWIEEQKMRRRELGEDHHNTLNAEQRQGAPKDAPEARASERLCLAEQKSNIMTAADRPSQDRCVRLEIQSSKEQVQANTAACVCMDGKKTDAQVASDARNNCIGEFSADEMDAAFRGALGVSKRRPCSPHQ
jgi:hypothetical protein